jgi:hypothetical protein
MWQKIKAFNRVATQVISTLLFSLIYILILPWFALFTKRQEKQRKTWYPWTLKSETLGDLKKQY